MYLGTFTSLNPADIIGLMKVAKIVQLWDLKLHTTIDPS